LSKTTGEFQMTPWFARDHTGRELTPRERQFVEALSQVLEDERVTQVTPDETALTAEGQDCLICLIPHRWLGGLSLVVWLNKDDSGSICWAEVGGLACCHDSLDLGRYVAEYQANALTDSFTPLIDGVRKELNRPLVMDVAEDGAGATVLLRGERGRLQRLTSLGNRGSALSRLWQKSPSASVESEICLTDSVDPPFREPSNALDWFKE